MSKMRSVIYHILFMLCKYTGNCYLIKHDAAEIDTWTLCFELWNNNQDTVLSMCFCLRTLKFDISELQRNTVFVTTVITSIFFRHYTYIYHPAGVFLCNIQDIICWVRVMVFNSTFNNISTKSWHIICWCFTNIHSGTLTGEKNHQRSRVIFNRNTLLVL